MVHDTNKPLACSIAAEHAPDGCGILLRVDRGLHSGAAIHLTFDGAKEAAEFCASLAAEASRVQAETQCARPAEQRRQVVAQGDHPDDGVSIEVCGDEDEYLARTFVRSDAIEVQLDIAFSSEEQLEHFLDEAAEAPAIARDCSLLRGS